MADSNSTITHACLLENLKYNPATGKFLWRKDGRGRFKKAGKMAGRQKRRGYIVIGLMGKEYYAHRLAWFYVYGVWPKVVIDHVNRDPSDNRLENLREANYSQNGNNTTARKNNKSGFKNVYFNSARGKWCVSIKSNHKHIFYREFDSLHSAGESADRARKEIHGEFHHA